MAPPRRLAALYSAFALVAESLGGLVTVPFKPGTLDDILKHPDILNYPWGSVTVNDPEITGGKAIKIPLAAPRDDPYAQTADDLANGILNTTLPLVMRQLGFSEADVASKIDKAIPAMHDVLTTLPGMSRVSLSPLAKRNFWDTLGGIFGSIGCGAVALVGLPLFLAVKEDFDILNHVSEGITTDQQFFAFPVYGNLALTGKHEPHWSLGDRRRSADDACYSTDPNHVRRHPAAGLSVWQRRRHHLQQKGLSPPAGGQDRCQRVVYPHDARPPARDGARRPVPEPGLERPGFWSQLPLRLVQVRRILRQYSRGGPGISVGGRL